MQRFVVPLLDELVGALVQPVEAVRPAVLAGDGEHPLPVRQASELRGERVVVIVVLGHEHMRRSPPRAPTPPKRCPQTPRAHRPKQNLPASALRVPSRPEDGR